MGAPGAHRGLRRTQLARPSRLMLGTTTSALGLACWGATRLAACGPQVGQILPTGGLRRVQWHRPCAPAPGPEGMGHCHQRVSAMRGSAFRLLYLFLLFFGYFGV
jgi:hypothetical protein